MYCVTLRGGDVVYATTASTVADVVERVRARIESGAYPVGLRHEANCGYWTDKPCRCHTSLDRLMQLDTVLDVTRSSGWGRTP